MRVCRQDAAGFTLLELVVVMGLLAGFCVMLVQLLTSGVRMFEEGEDGQALADRGADAARLVAQQWADMLGPVSTQPGVPQSRLLVQWVPLGWDGSLLEPAAASSQRPPGSSSDDSLASPPTHYVQMLRALVRIGEEEERELLERHWAGQLEGQGEDRGLASELARIPRGGRARLWLLPWPAGDGEGAYLQLRSGLFLPGTRIDTGEEEVDPMQVVSPSDELSAELVEQLTEPVLSGLLHVEFALWSQNTRGWDADPGQGPELAWDSARAGWLLDPEGPTPGFSLDLGPQSLTDPTDDVYPRWVRITLVIGRSQRQPAEAILAQSLDERAVRLRVVNPDRLRQEGGFVKVGAEWIAYTGLQGNELTGLRRGQRGTAALAHRSGAPVRVGRTVRFALRLHHGRESWNG